MSKKKQSQDVPDMIDRIYDCLEERMAPADMKGWLKMPNTALRGASPNELLKAGKAAEVLAHVESAFGCACSSTPTLVENPLLQ